MHPKGQFCGRTRREFLWETGAGFTGVALSAFLQQDGFFAKHAHAESRPRPKRMTSRSGNLDPLALARAGGNYPWPGDKMMATRKPLSHPLVSVVLLLVTTGAWADAP